MRCLKATWLRSGSGVVCLLHDILIVGLNTSTGKRGCLINKIREIMKRYPKTSRIKLCLYEFIYFVGIGQLFLTETIF